MRCSDLAAPQRAHHRQGQQSWPFGPAGRPSFRHVFLIHESAPLTVDLPPKMQHGSLQVKNALIVNEERVSFYCHHRRRQKSKWVSLYLQIRDNTHLQWPRNYSCAPIELRPSVRSQYELDQSDWKANSPTLDLHEATVLHRYQRQFLPIAQASHQRDMSDMQPLDKSHFLPLRK